MSEGKVIPHTRDCASHWDGECDCAPRTREELQQQIDALRESQRRWQNHAELWMRQRQEARTVAGEMRDVLKGHGFNVGAWEEPFAWLKPSGGADSAPAGHSGDEP